MQDIIIKNACVITGCGPVFPNGYVHISNGVVAKVGCHREEAPSLRGRRGDPVVSEIASPSPKDRRGTSRNDKSIKIIDAGGRYVLPGLINSHTHLYSYLARGISVGRMKTFGKVLEGLWWKLDKALTLDQVYVSAMLGSIEALKSGVTTLIDHHASYGAITGSLGAISQAFEETGIRGSTCYELSDRCGKKARDEGIEETALWLEKINSRAARRPDFKVRGMVGLHASLTLSDETLRLAAGLMDKFGVGGHVHVAEGIEDVIDSKKKYKKTPVARLTSAGILKEGSLAIHCVHASNEDLKMLKKCGTYVVHNPMSNLNNAVGIARVLEMHKLGIPVAIGTDGMSAGVADDIRLASVLHKPGVADAQAAWVETQKSVWEVAPRIVSEMFGFEVGVIRVGSAGDVIIIDDIPPTPVNSSNAFGHFLFGVLSARVRTSIVGGSVRMLDFKVKGVDEAVLASEGKRLAKKLWAVCSAPSA